MTAATLPEYRLIRTSDNTVLGRVRMTPAEAAMRNTEYKQAGYPLGETPVLGYDRCPITRGALSASTFYAPPVPPPVPPPTSRAIPFEPGSTIAMPSQGHRRLGFL